MPPWRSCGGHPRRAARVFRGGFYVHALCDISRGHASGSTSSPGASVESSPSVSEEDKADDSSSAELGGRAARELRWLGEILVVRQACTRGEPRQLDLDSAALFV